ncbi:MAG TPA: pyridoxamine 5'-phosphate oxidase [Burkholderiales bacterium]
MKLADLRQEYMRAGLSERDADADPLRQFGHWMDAAIKAGVSLPNAMTLATVREDGRPNARIVLLKGVEDGGFTFFTNYESRKGVELDARPDACLVFLWHDLERQVRIDGRVTRVTPAASSEYFDTRPVGARLSAWASAQSARVPDRATLEDALAAARQRFGEAPPRPPHWGGYRLEPSCFEFWQGRPDRLHDRLRYRRDATAWTIERLAP